MAALSVGGSAGEVLRLIASGEASTRTAVARSTGLSRATVAERLEVLFRAELISEGDEQPSTGGRPARTLTLNGARHVVVGADVGEDHTRLLLTDLTGAVLAERVGRLAVRAGADEVVSWIAGNARCLIDEVGRSPADLVGVGLSVPAPVDTTYGRVAAPSVMTGWEGVGIEALLRQSLDVPVLVENDVNARGYGEYLGSWKAHDEVFYVKAGTGIGSAIISAGGLFRGARGAAGDIGHIRLEPDSGPPCRCGAVGCVESLAAGWSIVRDLRAQGFEVADTRGAMALVAAHVPEAGELLRQAGRTLGRAIAYGVSLLNPDIVVVGGSLTSSDQQLLTGIRESVYQYSLPLATGELLIEQGRGGERCGAVGVAHIVIARVLQPDRINTHLKSLA